MKSRLLAVGWLLLIWVGVLAAPGAEPTSSRPPAPGPAQESPSRLIETAGVVTYRARGAVDWTPAEQGMALSVGDRLRTGGGSRAAVQFSDRSVLRLGEQTTLEIQPPRHAERRRFQLLEGLLFFFNRERPADVEFETPLVTGAIRGTEFALEAAPDTGATRLALLDGRVELAAAGTTVDLESGELARVDPGGPPIKSPLLSATRIVQWALYYPAVVHPGDLGLGTEDAAALERSLAAYRDGDLLAARAALPPKNALAEPPARRLYRAALELAVGQVEAAEAALARLEPDHPVVQALAELIAVVRGEGFESRPQPTPRTATEWLARSYTEQGRFRLLPALAAAEHAAGLAPDLGFAHLRVAELHQALEHRRAARAALDRALACASRLAPAEALRGFLALDQHDAPAALAAFDRARDLDAALGSAWLGRGLALTRLGRRDEALQSFQTAVALEPRRGLHRSYLARAFGQNGEDALAEKDFRLAKELDPADPTAWLYSALHRWQANRPNAAVRELEESVRRNDNRAVFRSRLLLDRDLAVRGADLAALYRDAGLPEVSRRSAALAVAQDYANFSGHLFLANSYQALEDPHRFDLRLEAARQGEWLLAALLAPPEAAGLSQLSAQQEHLRLFEPRAFGAISATEYRSSGSWRQDTTAFGTLDGLAYALDASLDWTREPAPNAWRDRQDVSLQLKQRVTPDDEVFFQTAYAHAETGDLARHYDPDLTQRGLRVDEEQLPNLSLGWHHTWSPASHTLLLVSRFADELALHNSEPAVLFLRRLNGSIASVQLVPFFDLQYRSELALYSAELQHLWQTENHALVAGVRAQSGDIEADARLDRALGGTVTRQELDEPLARWNAYAYHDWHIAPPLHLVGGLSYDHLTHPLNSETAPLSPGTTSVDLLAPKVGFLLTPWRDGLLRASYSRSLGGMFFDGSLRLEPTQLAGFNQVFRSLLPESVAGQVPGTTFDTVQVAFDQSWNRTTYIGLEGGVLHSDGERRVGALANTSPLPVPDAPSDTHEDLAFREHSVGAYAVRLIGEGLSLGFRYRLTESRLETRYPEVPATAIGHDVLQQDEAAWLQQAAVTLDYHHSSGFLARWESDWYHQHNAGFSPGLPDEDFWQHHVSVGYRLPRRRAELQVGVLNLFDQDVRLNPLNALQPLPRERTAVVSFKWFF